MWIDIIDWLIFIVMNFLYILKSISKRNLVYTLLKFIKRPFGVQVGTFFSWINVLDCCFCLFFILPPLSSAHALLVYDLLPFRVKRKVLGVVTCFSIVPDFNDPKWQQIINKKSMCRGNRRENEKETETNSLRH